MAPTSWKEPAVEHAVDPLPHRQPAAVMLALHLVPGRPSLGHGFPRPTIAPDSGCQLIPFPPSVGPDGSGQGADAYLPRPRRVEDPNGRDAGRLHGWGWAHTPFGKLEEPDTNPCFARVGRAAIEDAGITRGEIDAGFLGVFGEGFTNQGFPGSR